MNAMKINNDKIGKQPIQMLAASRCRNQNGE